MPSREYNRRQNMHSRRWRSIQSGLPESAHGSPELVKHALLRVVKVDGTSRNTPQPPEVARRARLGAGAEDHRPCAAGPEGAGRTSDGTPPASDSGSPAGRLGGPRFTEAAARFGQANSVPVRAIRTAAAADGWAASDCAAAGLSGQARATLDYPGIPVDSESRLAKRSTISKRSRQRRTGRG
jgi:hypothetical protein